MITRITPAGDEHSGDRYGETLSADADAEGDGETLPEDGWVQVTPSDEIPEPPPEIARAARFAPEHFIFMADPNWVGEGPAPSWAVLGRWRTDTRGEIVDWEDNDAYRPSPEALGWRTPADPVDEAAQRAVTGYGPVSEVPRALAREPRIAVVVEPDGIPRVGPAPDGTQVIPVFTMPLDGNGGVDGDRADEEPGLPPHRVTPVAELIDIAGETPLLYLSPTAPVTMTIDIETLRAISEGREVPEPAERPGPEEMTVSGEDYAVGQPPADVRVPALEDGAPAVPAPFELRGGLVSQDYGRPGETESGDPGRAAEAEDIQSER
ncbi:type VII secretion system-associated protein [Streptomyces sp. NBC_00328]|uniref:type VII secretion system-associated protein n=1 Tax=Streptomyces sp. NBC_00328 TaxID=2903646 RepID=UPI002E2E0593|nr:type VII secretion system-associated protein [Streptomyces sp. NBC_00328]